MRENSLLEVVAEIEEVKKIFDAFNCEVVSVENKGKFGNLEMISTLIQLLKEGYSLEVLSKASGLSKSTILRHTNSLRAVGVSEELFYGKVRDTYDLTETLRVQDVESIDITDDKFIMEYIIENINTHDLYFVIVEYEDLCDFNCIINNFTVQTHEVSGRFYIRTIIKDRKENLKDFADINKEMQGVILRLIAEFEEVEDIEELHHDLTDEQYLSEERRKALVEKDSYIEQLESCIENLKEEIEEYEEEIEHIDIENSYLNSIIKRQDKLIGELHFRVNEK